MRLLKPSFQTSMNAYTDEDTTMPSAVAAASSSSLYTQSLLKQTFVDHTQQHFFSSPHSAHTDLLVIPQIFGCQQQNTTLIWFLVVVGVVVCFFDE